jgi:hypothetical protein
MRINNKIITGLFVGGIALLGAAAGSVLSALPSSAASNTGSVGSSGSSSVTTAAANQGNFDPAKGGHVGANGKKEELLTGDSAEKVKAAALAAYPGGTIQRVENDAEGAAYLRSAYDEI